MMVMELGAPDGGHITTNCLELLKMIKNDEDFTPVAREVSAWNVKNMRSGIKGTISMSRTKWDMLKNKKKCYENYSMWCESKTL